MLQLQLFPASLVLGLCSLISSPVGSYAQSTTPLALHRPKACSGAVMQNNELSWVAKSGTSCPKDHALFAAGVVGIQASFYPAAAIALVPVCCPLPASDILVGEVFTSDSSCPPNSVAVGTFYPESRRAVRRRDERYPLVCQSINTTRYRLGEPNPGLFWGWSGSMWRESERIMRSQVALGLRMALARSGKFTWGHRGCVGDPEGSLLVAKTSKRCNGIKYRKLLFRGNPGDPPDGTAVKMLPECKQLEDRFAVHLRCRDEPSAMERP